MLFLIGVFIVGVKGDIYAATTCGSCSTSCTSSGSSTCDGPCGYQDSNSYSTVGCYNCLKPGEQRACTSTWTGCCVLCSSQTTCTGCSTTCGTGTKTCTDNCGGVSYPSCTETYGCCSAVDGGWSAWGACQANCTQTQTCTNPSPDCGGAGCSGPSSQTCGGDACRVNITGTVFDASDMSSCPGDIATNPAYNLLRFGGAVFDINSTTPTNQTVTTGANGVYTAVVAPNVLPKTYSFDFTTFLNSGRVTEIKFQCQGATITSIAGETKIKDTGFWRQYGGWWQAVGGNVHGQNGIGSIIPGSILPTTNQKLILADADGRTGVLSYGVPLVGQELGTNTNATVGAPQIESVYDGLRYDYNFYKTRMDIFASTVWDGGAISYDDAGKGYQIFKHTGPVTLDGLSLSGSQKVILLIDGSVTVNQDIIVPSGAFLAIIANGNITFNYNVNFAQGWFVAENINIPCHDTGAAGCDKDDIQFVGEGSFVGWTGINLERDMGGDNNQAPSEKFTYRADMLLNAPDPMRVYTKKFSPFVP